MKIMVEYLLVSSSFPTQEVYEAIGLNGIQKQEEEITIPTMCGKNYIREKSSSITYSTGYIETLDVRIPLEKLYNLLLDREEQIIKYINKYNIQSRFCIIINLTDNPIIQIPHKFMELACRLQADIEVDSYI